MSSTIHALQSLQRVELQLKALRDKVDRKKKSVRAAKKKLDRIREAMQQKHEEIKRLQASIAQIELDVRTHDAEISKLRDALNKSKTNKEYAAILTQINTDKADTSKLEDRILELMGEVETLRKQEDVYKQEEQTELKRLENAEKEAGAFEQGTHDELESLQATREQAASHVPPNTLSVFERASDRHDGEVLACVIQPHPKREEFICDGCHMSVTLEQFVALQSRDELQICQSCSRLLYIEESLAHRA